MTITFKNKKLCWIIMKSPSIPNSSYKATSLFYEVLSNYSFILSMALSPHFEGFKPWMENSILLVYHFFPPLLPYGFLFPGWRWKDLQRNDYLGIEWQHCHQFLPTSWPPDPIRSPYITSCSCWLSKCRYISENVIERRTSVNVACCLNSFIRTCTACYLAWA